MYVYKPEARQYLTPNHLFFQGTGQLGLVPYADLLNHSPYSSSNFMFNKIAFSKDKVRMM